jgi:CysZ protein
MGELFAGAAYPFRALGLIRRTPHVWGLILVPILINLIVGALLYGALLLAGLRAINDLIAGLPSWLRFADVLLSGLLIVGLLVVIGFLLVRFGVVIGAPFYGILSERLETTCTGQAPSPEPVTAATVARDVGRALLHELKKLALTLAVGLPLLLLGFVPVAGPFITNIGWVALGALIACLDFLDPPLERRLLRFRAKLGIIRRSLPASGGLGLVSFGLVSIPVLNLLAIPLCIAAGTLFFCERVQPPKVTK